MGNAGNAVIVLHGLDGFPASALLFLALIRGWWLDLRGIPFVFMLFFPFWALKSKFLIDFGGKESKNF